MDKHRFNNLECLMGDEMNNFEIMQKAPNIPSKWDYSVSVEKTKQFMHKWKTLNSDIAKELYIARHKLSSQGLRNKSSEVKTWSDYCIGIGSSRQVVNRWLAQIFPSEEKKIVEERKEAKRIERENTIAEMPKGVYSIIYADPPWQYEHSMTNSRKIENQYPTMELEDICALDIPSDKDSILFLWATAPKLEESLQVLNAWGFNYRTCAVWDKEIIGMGYWFRNQHELLLIGVKGNFSPPEQSQRYSSVFKERRGLHSKKPQFYYEMIENMFPKEKYLEVFARTKHSDKWEIFGNEVL